MGGFAITCRAQVDLSFASSVGYVDLVQDVSDNITKILGFDEDAQYWIGMSIREGVINAIRHGNNEDENKSVGVHFEALQDRLIVHVRDEGAGFDFSKLPDPRDPQNLLKASGRGVFYVRTFMDEVAFSHLPEGGLELRMEKRLEMESKGDSNEN